MTTTAASTADTPRRRPFYWERWAAHELPPGEELAVFRREVRREPGGAPAMWRHYTKLDEAGTLNDRLRAEHLALGLFAMHQQGQRHLVHADGVRLGQALRTLRNHGKFHDTAVDARVTRLATSTSLDELAHHLTSLISMLGALPLRQQLDYTRLYLDVLDWQSADVRTRTRVLRRWGADYVTHPKTADASATQTSSTTN